MSTFWANPSLFSAYAAAAKGDPDLLDATHIRLFPSSRIGFPLGPFRLWNVLAEPFEPRLFGWFDNRGKQLADTDLDAAGGEAHGWPVMALPDNLRLVGVEISFQNGAGEVALLDRVEDRVIAKRSVPRFLVAAPRITRVRLRGNGRFSVVAWVVNEMAALERMVGDAAVTLSLPVEGTVAWYAQGEGSGRAWDRVGRGAPKRWTRPDRMEGPFQLLSPQAEQARITASRDEIDAQVAMLLNDPQVAPKAVTDTREWAAVVQAGERRPWQRTELCIQNALLMKALDPGIARYLGLMTCLPPELGRRRPTPRVWLAGGVFLCFVEDRLLFPYADDLERRLLERWGRTTPGIEAWRNQIFGPWIAEPRVRMELRAFVAPALEAPLPDLLDPANVRLGSAQWLRAKQGPSTRFRQQFLVKLPPPAALVALARQEGGDWATRHIRVDMAPGSDPSKRAASIALGTRETMTDGRDGLADDADIPANGAPWIYRLALADVFGRYGLPAEIAVPLPARPLVPQPDISYELHPGALPNHRGPASPGSVVLQVAVPSVDDLGAGALPIARTTVEFNGTTQSLDAPPDGGKLAFEFPLPDLAPMETRRFQARAWHEDSDGSDSTPATVSIDVADRRPPLIPKTGIGIRWTSRPGPASDVVLRAILPGEPNTRHRAYLADARGLGVRPNAEDGRPRTRAEIAVEGAGLAMDADRAQFRLITETPITVPADGPACLDVVLPRSLETVQFVRVVPLSQRGVEADFASCPLLPVAVPAERPPPAPRVEVSVDPATGVPALTVVADGLDLVALAAAEPGLFGLAPLAANRSPRYRLKRSIGAVSEALYARDVARGDLELDGTRFVATVPDPGDFIAYVRYFYWAQVQMPAERRIPADVVEQPPPDGAIIAAQRHQNEDAPGSFSLASAPAPAIRIPPAVPALVPETVSATVSAGVDPGTYAVSVEVVDGPVVHPKAVGAFSARIYLREDDGDLVLTGDGVSIDQGTLSWSVERMAAAIPQVRVMLILVDPIGREAPAIEVAATPV